MAEMTFPHLPNQIDYNYQAVGVAWVEITAGLNAEFLGKPGTAMTLRSTTGTGGTTPGLAAGSAFKFKIGGAIPTTDVEGRLVEGAGQTFSNAGPVNKLYVRPTVATDRIVVSQYF